MCTLVPTTTELMVACFDKDTKNFLRLYNALQSKRNSFRALVWCVQSGWDEMVNFLTIHEGVSPHQEGANVLCEAVEFGQKRILKYMLNNWEYREQKYFSDVIDAIIMAEKKCQHEIAAHLLFFLLRRTSEAALVDNFGFKMSKSLRTYIHQRDYIYRTDNIRKVHYLQPIIEC